MTTRAQAILASAALALAVGPSYAISAPPPEPPQHPDWTAVNDTAIRMLQGRLIDPASMVLIWTSGLRWGYLKNAMEPKQYGWVACGKYNAKNRMGGYVGFSSFITIVDEKSMVQIQDDVGDAGPIMNAVSYHSSCIDGPFPPVNPELTNVDPNGSTRSFGLDVADEIAKLADLRNKGLITQAEFDARKAKLLDQ